MAYQVHRSKRTSQIVTGAFLVVVAVLVGGAVVFWFDQPKLVQHVQKKDDLAVLACQVLAMQGAPESARMPLIEALETGQPSLRAAAAKALGSRRSHEDVPYLGKAATRDAEAKVRAAACEGLGVVGEGYAREWLRFAIDDPDLDVQAAACLAVGQCKVLELAPYLVEKVDATHPPLKKKAINGLQLFLGPGEFDPGGDRRKWHDWWVKRSQR
jgi:hypothetical protein